jgi:hypothetical protein
MRFILNPVELKDFILQLYWPPLGLLCGADKAFLPQTRCSKLLVFHHFQIANTIAALVADKVNPAD